MPPLYYCATCAYAAGFSSSFGYPLNVARRGQVGAWFTTSLTTGLHSDISRLGIFPPDKRKTPPAVKLEGLQLEEEGKSPACCESYYLLSNPAM